MLTCFVNQYFSITGLGLDRQPSQKQNQRQSSKRFQFQTNTPTKYERGKPMTHLRGVTIALVAMILGWAVAAQAQAVKGTGTANTIPVWTSSSMIGNSLIKQSGGNVTVGGGLATQSLSSGNLTLTGSINSSLTLQGNLTDSNLDQSANVIGGFGGNNTFPGNSVASGVVGATIAGGGGGILVGNFAYPNVVTAAWGTIGGGANNQVGGGDASTVAGGFQNIVSSTEATIGGGNQNTASGDDATIGGGGLNTASGNGATVGGGGNNTASGMAATIAGGAQNTASLEGATVAGGENNKAAGKFAMVPGGLNASALGQSSFAAGHIATANYDGSFVWSDTTGIASDNAANQFIAQASGGFALYTAPNGTAGAILVSGSGSWSMQSDRNVKSNLMRVDGQALLMRLAALPIATWNYKAQSDSTRHMGPTAQDFHEAFGLGEDDRYISTVDAEGVALAAIQALYKTVTELKQSLGDKDQQIAELRARLAHLEQRK
jgi:hypothetical protein